mmetsp:Transcript_26861/g.65278  ORF Transcript_26861/g.65278 Transcript_26861/m.65278 type:complete len:306 (-) Transcript_26861:325-1242(-)
MQPASVFGALQDYTLPAPTCSITANDEVQCDFAGIVPATGNLAYSITGYTDCTGLATRDAEMVLSAATATAVAGADTVTVDLNTNFDLADGASEVFEFCLLTSLQDGSSNEMIYQGQKISATFTGDGEFTVTGITTVAFDGVSGTVITDSKAFTVTAYRCDVARAPISTPALTLGTTLYICVDADDDSSVIKSVDTFSGSKISVGATDLLAGNTEVIGAGTNAVTIGTRPFSSFFADANTMDVIGTVTLDVDNNVVRRNLRMLQNTETDKFELFVEMEAAEESSAPSVYGTAGVALLGALGVAAM